MKALVPLAEGCEEMEAVIAIDVLRRAEVQVRVAGLSGGVVRASRGVGLVPDQAWDAVNPAEFDLLLLPGGMEGALALCRHAGVQEALRAFHAEGKWIGAICAGPLALEAAGLLTDRSFTCYPGIEDRMSESVAAGRLDEPVVVDGRLVTSQGPGTAFAFALELVARCQGAAVADLVRVGLLL